MTKVDNFRTPPAIRAAVDQAIWIAESGWDYFSEIVESPIERLLLEQMLAGLLGVTEVTGLQVLGRTYEHGEDRFMSGHGILCYPQGKIGDYRADFVLDTLFPFRERTIFVVECDGHDFHDRTKEQAERDRQRDRFMVARGIKVLRFTGREINRCAESVWNEIVDVVTDGRGRQWGHHYGHQWKQAAGVA